MKAAPSRARPLHCAPAPAMPPVSAPASSLVALPRTSRVAPLDKPVPAPPLDSSQPEASETESRRATKKRVRLRPETREQLLERLRNPQLSLHEASILLKVSRATVRRYADAGRLPCERTPGGQRRFYLRDIENFYRALRTKR